MNFLYLTQEGKAGSEAWVVCLTQPATWCQPWVVEVAQRLGAQGGGQGRALGKGGGGGAEMLRRLKRWAAGIQDEACGSARGQGSGVATPQIGTPGEKEGSRALEWKVAGE